MEKLTGQTITQKLILLMYTRTKEVIMWQQQLKVCTVICKGVLEYMPRHIIPYPKQQYNTLRVLLH